MSSSVLSPDLIRSGYFADRADVDQVEQRLAQATSQYITNDVGAIILSSPNIDGEFGTIGRSLEVEKGFTEMPATTAALERASKFIYIVDKTADSYVVHSTRLVEPTGREKEEAVEEILEDLSGQVTLSEAKSYHGIRDIGKCLLVSTDLAVPGVLPTRTKPYGLLAYKALFSYAESRGATHVFAYMNSYTLRGLGRVGITPEELCGRNDYTIPPMGDLTFEAYQPYVITGNKHNIGVFNDSEYADRHSRWGAMMASTDLPILQMADRT